MREHVFGVLVLQDVVAVGLITALTAVSHGEGLSATALVGTLGGLLGALVGMVIAGLFVVPRLIRWTLKMESVESLTVVVGGVCFGFALLAELMGYSVALGAFVAGVLVAESGEGTRVEHLMQPMRDIFAAVFFVSVGMAVDPLQVWAHMGVSLLVVAVVIAAHMVSVTLAGVFSGNGLRRSLVASLALGQIGEFAFVIAGIGVGAGVVRPSLQPIVVTVAAITTFTTPLLLRSRERLLGRVDAMIPGRLQTLIALYEAWFDDLRGRERRSLGPLRRTVRVIALDGVGVIALVIAVRYGWAPARGWLEGVGLSTGLASVVVGAASLVVASPLLWSLARSTWALGDALADGALASDEGEGGDGLEGATRWLLRAAAPLMVVIGVGVPLAAIVRPMFGGPYAAAVVLALVLILGVLIWRAAAQVDAGVRSRAGQLLELIDRQRAPEVSASAARGPSQHIVNVSLEPTMFAVGATLAGLDLRARTGATVVAIRRADGEDVLPKGDEPLMAGDQLVLVGSDAALDRARGRLSGEGSPTDHLNAVVQSPPRG